MVISRVLITSEENTVFFTAFQSLVSRQDPRSSSVLGLWSDSSVRLQEVNRL